MTDLVWRDGPPPHIGWWNASLIKDVDAWRWWNGVGWSEACFPEYGAKEAALNAKEIMPYLGEIFWTDYWPENARVPRINPGGA